MQPAETTQSFKLKPFALNALVFCRDKGFLPPPLLPPKRYAEAPVKTSKNLILDEVYISLIKLLNFSKEIKLKISVSLEAFEK